MSRTVPDETPKQITLRWFFRVCLLFLLAAVALLALFLIWRTNLWLRAHRAEVRLQQAGYPVSFAEAGQKYYPEISSNQNAAIFFERAFALLPGTNDPKIPMFPHYQSTNHAVFFSQKNLDGVGHFVISNRACLDFLRQSPAAANCRYPIKFDRWDEILVPHLAKLKESALMLSIEAFTKTRNGDTAGAVEDLNAIFRLGHSLDGEPLIISQKVRFSLVNILGNTLEEMLNTQPFTDALLSALATNFHNCSNPNIMEFATALEFCTFLQYFNLSGSEVTALGKPKDEEADPLPRKFENAAYKSMRAAGFTATDHALFLEAMERQLQVVRLPFPQRLDSSKEVYRWVKERAHHTLFDCELSTLTCSITERAQFDEATMEARLSIIRAVLAIERYRLASANSLPDTLAALVPSVLDSVPLDPFDGKPVRYKKLTKGYMVYSIGPDRKDDGGVPSYGIRTDAGFPVDEIRTNRDPRMRLQFPLPGIFVNGMTNWDITFVVEH